MKWSEPACLVLVASLMLPTAALADWSREPEYLFSRQVRQAHAQTPGSRGRLDSETVPVQPEKLRYSLSTRTPVDGLKIASKESKRSKYGLEPYAAGIPAGRDSTGEGRAYTGVSSVAGGEGETLSGRASSLVQTGSILVSTTATLPGYRITAYRGVARGDVVIQPTIMQSFKASIKSVVGGKISGYIRMCKRARNDAFNDMLEQVRQLGANAVIGVRYDSSTFPTEDSKEVGTEAFCYGTAVTAVPER